MNDNILGSGGGSDAHTPVDSPNSLISKTTARVLFLLSDGEVGGLYDQTNKLKSVYFNNIPVMNADGSTNFANISVDERYGLPSQAVMSGYPSASSTFNVGAKVSTGTPVTYTSSTSAPDAIRVTIRFPALFAQQANGDTTGTTVNFQIYTKLGTGAFTLIKDITKTDKCTSPADTDYLINRPTGAGTWSVKVVRVTADNASTTMANDTYFQTATEIQYAQLPYNNRAYIGMKVTAEATGSSFPLISFDEVGMKIKVPSNYTVGTRSYSGVWDGTFKTLKEVCDNPAWVLYDLLTNPTHGMGTAISAADVDQYSFYDAAVYNDGLVPALVGGVISGTEPRYTFNYQLMAQDTAWATIQNIAAAMGASVYTSGNRVRLVQDRPTTWSRLITNSNVVDGLFEYTSSQKNTRTSASIVYWNNPAENWLSVPAYYEDAAGTARYGLTVSELTGLGITTEGQAQRLAKWTVDTSLNNTNAVIFKVGFSNAGMEPGEVVKLMDTDYAQVMNEAKVLSYTSTSVTLDRPVTAAIGYTLDIAAANGTSVYTVTVTAASTGNVVTFASTAMTLATGADLIITGAVSPQYFKITNVKEESPGVWMVSGVQYDPNKFGRVDNTPTGNVAVYQAPSTLPSAPLNLAFRESSTNNNGVIQRGLMVSWSRPVTGTIKNYLLRYRRANTSWNEVTLNTSSYDLQNVLEGQYDVQVYARSAVDIMGPESTGSYTITSTGGGASLLAAPTTLQLVTGGTAFSGQDINFQWTNPTGNGAIAATLKDFEVRFIETGGSTTVRTAYYTAVAPGSIQTASYTFAMNTADGGPRRTMQIQVRCRDSNNNLSNPVTVSFTNAAPAVPSSFAVSGGIGTIFASWVQPTDPDFSGVLVWMSTTSGFTPSAANLITDESGSLSTLKMISAGVPHYVRIGAYDVFAKSTSGTGMNLSTEQSATPVASAGIPNGSATPGTGTEGDLFFNTTDGKLYRYHSGAWTTAVPTVDLVGTVSSAQIAAGAITQPKFASGLTPVEIVSTLPATGNFQGRTVVLTTDNKLYRYTGSAWTTAVPTTDLSGTLTDAQLAAISASKITGTLTDAQLAAIAASKLTGQIVTTQITDSAITTAKVAAGAITASQIAADTITAGQIAASAITSSELAAGAVIAGKITAGTIVSGDIAASTITASNIAANTITATQIAASTITAAQIAGNTITAGQIAAGTITSGNIAAGSITADRLYVTARGKALNQDPSCSDPTCWSVGAGSISFQTDTGLPIGTNKITATNGTQIFSKTYPIEAAKTYKITLYAKQVSGGGLIYIRQYSYNSAGSNLSYVVTGLTPTTGSLEGLTVPGTWTRYTGYITPAAGCVYAQIYLHVNWSTTGVTDLTDIRCEEYIGSDLIVDGTITSQKIQSNTIVGGNIAAGTLTAFNIASNTITSSQIAANTITAGQIAASTITASQIAANTITTNQIAANTIVAGNIAASTIDASKMNVSSLSAISANIGSITAGSVSGIQFTTGSFTGYAWPAAGLVGSYLGPSGLLIGNANNGRYFQVEGSTGNVYAPGLTIVSGTATFSGTLSAASGTFSGSLSAASGTFSGSLTTSGIVTAANIVAGGLSSAYSASTTSTTASVSVTIPSGARMVTAMAFFGSGLFTTTTGSGKSGTSVSYQGPADGNMSGGSLFSTVASIGSAGIGVSNPAAGTYTISATRTPGSGGATYYGVCTIVVVVTNR